MTPKALQQIDLILPSISRHFSGVTATVAALLPHHASRLNLAIFGSHLPDSYTHLNIRQLIRLLRTPPANRPFRIWHARRNTEMIAGLIARTLARHPVKLVFTSATSRHSKPLTRRLIRQMDAVIAVAPGISERIGRTADAVIPHGIDCDIFRPAPDRQALWSQLGFGGESGIVTIGRVRPSKGTDLFVEAMIRLLPDHPGFVAVIAGLTTPPYRGFEQQLQAKIRSAGLADRIRWAGFVDHPTIIRLYQAASLVVAPSRTEGFGLTPIEAMACGTPVVASSAGAYATLMQGLDIGGSVPCGDADALTEKIRLTLADPRSLSQPAQTCRQHVLDRFTIQKEAQAIEQIYEQLWQNA